jgi:hypothetical protein
MSLSIDPVNTSPVTHIAIHHDPDGRCNWLLKQHLPDLRTMFKDSFVVVTQTTFNNLETRSLLESAGFRITVRSSGREAQNGTAAHISLVAGYDRGQGNYLFFGCLDRTLHWLHHYPEELQRVLTNGMQDSDYIVVGRTERAFLTHPLVQQQPETETNMAASRLLNLPDIDVAAGCRMMTKPAAREIVQLLARKNIFTNRGIDVSDSLWPLIVHLEGQKVGSIRTEGLEFETPDQYGEEIRELGYEKWVEANFTPANLAIREQRVAESTRVMLELAENWQRSSKEKR